MFIALLIVECPDPPGIHRRFLSQPARTAYLALPKKPLAKTSRDFCSSRVPQGTPSISPASAGNNLVETIDPMGRTTADEFDADNREIAEQAPSPDYS